MRVNVRVILEKGRGRERVEERTEAKYT